MTKDESKIKDWRSTGRRKARRELYAAYVPYKCVGYTKLDGTKIKCGKTTIEPPKDAPAWFNELWPKEYRVLTSQLQADHVTKDWQNNEVENLEWRCDPHHKAQDRQTPKGIPQKKVNLW